MGCVHGEYGGKAIYSSASAELRDDELFVKQTDKTHHMLPCPLSPLPVGFVSRFGLDYMHLVCLGVMRRLIMY